MGRWGYRTSSNHPLPNNSSIADLADLISPGLFEGDMDVEERLVLDVIAACEAVASALSTNS